MAKFKQIPQNYLFSKLVGYWGNMVRNYQNDCQDDDFFNVLRECFDHDKAVELIQAAYTEDELEEMKKSCARRERLDFSDSLNDIFRALWNHEQFRDKCRVVLDTIRECMLAETGKIRKDDRLKNRFEELQRGLKLSDLELEILLVSYVRNQTSFDWPCRIENREKPLYYAMALDRSYAEVLDALAPKGTLLKFNLLDDDYDFNFRMLGSYVDGTKSEAIERRFYKESEAKDILPWSYYGSLAEKDGELLKRMIAAANGKCNILFYGAPGTGKTSFARSLVHELGRKAFEIKQGDDDGKNMRSEARMIGVQICNGQESPHEAVMIVDEADELLRGKSGSFSFFGLNMGGKSTEKGVMNTLLDEMRLPAIWISNAPADAMDESVRRRFDYSICFEELTNSQRVSIWRNVVAQHGLGGLIGEGKIAAYAASYATSAGGIATVLENVKRLAPAPDTVDELIAKLMKPHCKLMGIAEANKFLPAKGYSLEGLNIKGKVSLDRIVKSVRNYLDASFNAKSEDKPRMNLLMFGPPGTGKTEFVKYLGKELDRKVIVMNGSNILSKWVGEAEQNIARAFRRAEAERAILFFDEIDGLVQDRANARASWEVTQVNELLQQMENFDGVMIAATNFCRNLDPAIMRRFTFKLEFDYLDDAGKKSFFERMFKATLTDGEFADLKAIRNLAPGDFRTVRQEQFYLGDEVTNLDRIAALREESMIKKDGDKTAKIGFVA